jgi:DNA recombination protein Rad52
MSIFDADKIALMNESLSRDDVKTREGTGGQKLSYIPSYHAINEANRLFGFGGWNTEIMHIHQVDKTIYEKKGYKQGDPPKEMISISYTCHLKLIVNGEGSASHEDIGFGNGVAGNTPHGIGSCIELATKEAVTDSLKRCLRYYGNKFGLSLYDKDVTLMGDTDIEDARLVSPDQLKELSDLYPRRGISDEWVLTAIKADGYPNDYLELMRNDWFKRAYQIAKNYKMDIIEREDYDANIEKTIKMLGESATVGMLQGLFQEVWTKAGKYEDKPRQQEAKNIYDKMKLKLGV